MRMDIQPEQRPWLKRLLRSPQDDRLRVVWRLAIHSTLFTLLLIPSSLVFVTVAIASGTPSFRLIDVLISGSGYLSLGAALLATWIARRFLDHRSMHSLGFVWDRRSWRELLFGFGMGALLMGIVFGVELLCGWLEFQAWAWDSISPTVVLGGLLSGLSFYIAVGVYEELIFRGYQLQNMSECWGLGWGLSLSSIFFALAHGANFNVRWMSLVGILVAGVLLAFGWVRTGRLWLPIGLHIGWNFFQGTIFGFPVSGYQTFSLIRHIVDGPDLLTGGDFGPEAGLIIFPAMALGFGLIWAYTHRNQQPTSPDEQVT